MTIERSLDQLRPRRPRTRNDASIADTQVPAVAKLEFGASPDSNALRLDTGTMRTEGPASLDTGNDYGGMPQAAAEFRGIAETAIRPAAQSGNIVLDLARANVFRLTLNGAATITFSTANWPVGAYQRSAGVGIDISCSVIIEKGASSLTIECDHWAPDDNPPDLTAAGFYEIGFAILMIGSETIVRGYLVIKPE